LALSLVLGLLVGVERERRKRERDFDAIAGLRTFGLVGFLGGLARYIDAPHAVVVGALALGGLVVAGYALDANRERDRGLTTEVALLLTYFLGALALEKPTVAAAATIVTASLLYFRAPLHALVATSLRDDELRDGLVILVLAFVVLPMVPDVNVGPYRAINPQTIARLSLVITFVGAAGYVTQRILGARWGLVASGFGSGFVSSTATIAALGLRAKQDPSRIRPAAAGAAASSIATVVQYAAIVGAIDRSLLAYLAFPLGFALAAIVLATAAFAYQAHASAEPQDAPKGRAFQVLPPLLVALASGAVSLLAAASSDLIGDAGIVLVSAASGVVDAHATTASIAGLHRTTAIDPDLAVVALIAALTSNTATKIAMATMTGPRAYVARVAGATLLTAAAGWAGVLVERYV
jgi:uncharacterized membrane protein (DUF4010 family)